MLKFNLRYFFATLILLFTEICIALFIHDSFIRPYIGDLLVVVLIYCLVKSFFNFRPVPIAIGVLIFSFIVEALQFFKVVELLGVQDSKVARIVIGTSFSWEDLIAYVAGISLVLLVERTRNKKS